MLKHRDAIVRLLTDEDPATIDLTKRQLVSFGPTSISALRELQPGSNDLLGGHVQDVIAEIEAEDAEKKLEALCADVASAQVLEGACWLLAQFFLPRLDVPGYSKRFDLWAYEIWQNTIATQSDLSRVQVFGDFFSKQLGFRGNSENYYDLKNALLPFVIDA